MAFQDERLPVAVERGARGGPRFKTTIIQLSSGFEQRNIEWERVRGKWDLAYGLDSKANLESVLSRWYTAQGKAHSFRFKDWTDYNIGSSSSPQEIAEGDNSTTKFQIVRRYTSGSYNYDRAITRPVSAVEVYLAGSLQGSGYTVDYDTGVVTFSTAPGMGVSVGIVGEFDIPVRFDIDELDQVATGWDGNYQLPQINIVEVRESLASLA